MNGVTVKLDKDRVLKYRWVDVKEIGKRLGGKTTSKIVELLGESDADAITVCLAVGLSHAEKVLRKDLDKVDDLIQAGFDNGTTLSKMAVAVLDGFKEAGLYHDPAEKKADGADAPGP